MEHEAPITLTDVKYVPGVKKNLLSVTMSEDKGYDVVFNKGKVFFRHITTWNHNSRCEVGRCEMIVPRRLK